VGKDIKVIYAQKDPYFNGENTLALEKNGCSQERTTLHFPDIFCSSMERNEQILDFLFSDKAKKIFERGYLEAKLFVELMDEVAKRAYAKELPDSIEQKLSTVSPILQYGEKFLDELGDYSPPTSPESDFFSSRSRSPKPTLGEKLKEPIRVRRVEHDSIPPITPPISDKKLR